MIIYKNHNKNQKPQALIASLKPVGYARTAYLQEITRTLHVSLVTALNLNSCHDKNFPKTIYIYIYICTIISNVQNKTGGAIGIMRLNFVGHLRKNISSLVSIKIGSYSLYLSVVCNYSSMTQFQEISCRSRYSMNA